MPTYLVTDKEIIQGSPLAGNVDHDKYRSLIEDVQDLVIEPILGTKLYDKILSDFAGSTLTGVYATIHTDYLKKIIINSVAAEYVVMASVVVSNAGTVTPVPQNMQPAPAKQVNNVASRLKAKADTYIKRLQKYLQDQQSNISEYTSAQDNDYDIKPDRDVQTYGGLYIPYPHKTGSTLEQLIWKDIIHNQGR